MIENLVFEGGGVKGAVYAGAIAVLDELGLYKHVMRVAGASAGAITAALLASGGGSPGLMASVVSTNFHDFIQDKGGFLGDITRFVRNYGLHTGDRFVEILRAHIKQHCGNADLTFQQLHDSILDGNKNMKQLFVVASNLSKQRAHIFCQASTPKLEIWKAVRASISIPFIFAPMKIEDSYYADGGMTWNYPIDLFDAQQPHLAQPGMQENAIKETLGFYLQKKVSDPSQPWADESVQIDSMGSYCRALGTYMFEVSNRSHIHPNDLNRTVFINDLGVKAASFGTPKEVVIKLIESGRQATSSYFDVGNKGNKRKASA